MKEYLTTLQNTGKWPDQITYLPLHREGTRASWLPGNYALNKLMDKVQKSLGRK